QSLSGNSILQFAPLNADQSITVSASNPDHYFGENPKIQLTKAVTSPVVGTSSTGVQFRWNDANHNGIPDPGETISYGFTVKNPGNVPLRNITVTDPRIPSIQPVLSGSFNIGDTNQNNKLDGVETWLFTGRYTLTLADIQNLRNSNADFIPFPNT